MFWQLLQQHLFDIIQTIFLVLGFGLAAKSYQDDDRSRQVGHLIQLGDSYHKIINTLIEKSTCKQLPAKAKSCVKGEFVGAARV